MKIKKILALMAAGTILMTMGGCNAITIDGEENVREGSSGNVIGFSVSTPEQPVFRDSDRRSQKSRDRE